jgi:hypothetical protein
MGIGIEFQSWISVLGIGLHGTDLVGIPKIEGIYRVDWRENVSDSD